MGCVVVGRVKEQRRTRNTIVGAAEVLQQLATRNA
jgi:hypothetical protein